MVNVAFRMRRITGFLKGASGEALLLAVLVAAAFCLRWHCTGFHPVMAPDYDGVRYLWLAEKVFSGERFWTVFMPPGFPLILAFFLPFFQSSQSAGMFVSSLFGAGLCAAVYLFSRELFGRPAAALSAVLVGVLCQLVIMSTWVMSEMPFAFFLYLGLYFGAVFARKGDTLSALIFCGLFGFAYLIRPEAFVIFFMACACIAASWMFRARDAGIRKRVLLLAATAALFIVICAPYLLYIKGQLGYWSLSGKARYNLAVSAEDKTLATKTSTLDYFTENREKLFDKYRANVSTLGQIADRVYPAVVLLLAAFGAAAGLLGIRRRPMSFFLPLAPFGFALALPFFFIDVRIMGPYYPLPLVWAAAGVVGLEKLMSRFIGDRPAMRLHPVAVVLALGLILYYAVDLNDSYNDRDFRDITRWLKNRYLVTGGMLAQMTSPGEKIVCRDDMLVYYAGRKSVHLGDVSPERVLKLARDEGARYVVVDDICTEKNRALGPLLGPFTGKSASVPGFELVRADARGEVLIYRLTDAR